MNNILIVEDDLAMNKAMNSILTKAGYKITSVNNGKDAFEYLNKFEYDLVLTDLIMNINNGYEVITRVKEIYPNTPIIVVTSISSENMIEEVFKLGADEVLRKPILAGELLIRVRRLLNTPDIKVSL